MSGNVIYGIDLNPPFKPRAIIQSRSPFPSFSISTRLPPFSIVFLVFVLPAPAVYYPLRARSILNIYLGTYSSYSPRGTSSRITCTRIANLLKASFILSSSITNGFLYGIIAPLGFISRLVISTPLLFRL